MGSMNDYCNTKTNTNSNNNNTNTDTNTNTTTSNSSCRGGIGSGLSRCFCATAEGGDEVFEPGRRRIGGDTWL